MSRFFSPPSANFQRNLILFLSLSLCLMAPAVALAGWGRDTRPEDDEEGLAFLLIVLETLLTLLVQPMLLTRLARVRFGWQLPTSTAYLALLLALLQVLFLARIAFFMDLYVFHRTAALIGWSPHLAKALLVLHCVGYVAAHQGLVLLALGRLAAPLSPPLDQWLRRRAWWLLVVPLVLFAWLGLMTLYEKSARHIVYPDQWRLTALALLIVAAVAVMRGLPALFHRAVAWQPEIAGAVWLVAPLAAFVVLDLDGSGSMPTWVQLLVAIAAVVLGLRHLVTPRRANWVYALACLGLFALDAGIQVRYDATFCAELRTYTLEYDTTYDAQCQERAQAAALSGERATAVLGGAVLLLLGLGEMWQRRRRRVAERMAVSGPSAGA